MLLLLLSGTLVTARLPWRKGDWVSYTNLRNVICITVSPKYVYFGTTEGIAVFNRFSYQWEDPLTTSDGLPNNSVIRLAYEPETDALWAETRAGIAYFQSIFQDWYPAPNFPAGIDFESRPPKTPLPSYVTDIDYVLFTEGYVQDRFLRRYPIRTTLADDLGSTWYGTAGLGVAEGTLRNQRLTFRRFGLFSSVVTAMAIDGDDIWFGGYRAFGQSGGITRWNRSLNDWKYFEAPYQDGLISDNITAIAVDSQYVWFGTDQGLVRYDKRKEQFKSYSRRRGFVADEVTALDSDADYVYIGSLRGITLLDKRQDSLFTLNTGLRPRTEVNVIKAVADTIWLATTTGVYRKAKTARQWTRFFDPDHILVAEVRSISLLADELWLGGEFGLVKYQLSTGKITGFERGSATGLLRVRTLAVDSTYVWASVPGGVWRWHRQTDSWRFLTPHDGLIDTGVNQIVFDSDYLWFATNKGATRFYWKGGSGQ